MKYLFFLTAIVLGACAPARFVEPLDKGELSVGANFGGPIIDFAGAPIPVPLTAIEAGYGIDTNLTVHGGLHTTAAIFGNFQMDAGVTYQFLEQNRYIPNVSVNPGFNLVVDLANVDREDVRTKFWPTLDLNAFWNYGERRNYAYIGVNNYFELTSMMANEQVQANNWIFSPQIGHVVKGKSNKWQLITEIKFLAPYRKNTYSFIPYKSLLGANGATGVFIGYRRLIGTNR